MYIYYKSFDVHPGLSASLTTSISVSLSLHFFISYSPQMLKADESAL